MSCVSLRHLPQRCDGGCRNYARRFRMKRKIKLSEEPIQALERFDPGYRGRHIQVGADFEVGDRPRRRTRLPLTFT